MRKRDDRDISSTLAGSLRALRRRPSVLLGLLVFALVWLLWTWRIQRGVDMSDESLYVAVPMCFALGDLPFLDDRSSFQGAGIMTAPLVFLYRLVVGSSDGVVLFMRVMFVSFLTGIGVLIARSVRGWIAGGTAIACGALACFFVPYYIAQLSYNTMGGGLAMLASFESLRVARSATAKEAARHALICGLAAAGSGLAYPTLGALFPVHLVMLLVFGRAHLGAWRVALRYFAGAAILGAYVGLFVIRAGFGSLRLTLDFIAAWGPSLTNSAKTVIEGVEALKGDWFTTLTIALALTILAMRFRPAVIALAIAVPFLAAASGSDIYWSLRLWSCLALFAPLFAVLVEDRRMAFKVLMIVWLPGMIAGFVTGYSSGNGARSCGIGAFTCVVAGSVLAARAIEESLGSLRSVLSGAGMVAPLALLYALTVRVFDKDSIYRDQPFAALTTRVGAGPFKGLWTTAVRRELVETMHRDVVAHSQGGGFVLFLPDMSSAYLSTNARPAIPEIWVTNNHGRAAIEVGILMERLPRITAVFIRSCPGANDWSDCKPYLLEPKNPLHAAVNEHFEEDFRRFDYAVMRRRVESPP